MSGRPRRSRPRGPAPVPPPPLRSERLYLRLPRPLVARLRFLLEGCDNLCYASILDRYAAVAVLVFSPHQRAEVLALVRDLTPVLQLERIELP